MITYAQAAVHDGSIMIILLCHNNWKTRVSPKNYCKQPDQHTELSRG